MNHVLAITNSLHQMLHISQRSVDFHLYMKRTKSTSEQRFVNIKINVNHGEVLNKIKNMKNMNYELSGQLL